jgi:hypothetical protein
VTELACGYCDDPITNSQYTYKWFPEAAKHLPVHNSHLTQKAKPYKYQGGFDGTNKSQAKGNDSN